MSRLATLVSFTTVNTRRLRRRGLRGRSVHVDLTDDAIVLTGAEGGLLALPLHGIDRMRVGFEPNRTGIIRSLRLWLADGSGWIRLHAWDDLSAYGRFVRRAVAAMLEPGRCIVVETGSSWFIPMTLIGIFGALSLASAAGTLFGLGRGEGDWQSPAWTFSATTALCVAGGWYAISRYAPRRITDLADVDRALPGC